MTIISYKIPGNKVREVSDYISKAGGRKISLEEATKQEDEDDLVTHEVYFGENINRFIKALSNK